MPIPLVCSNPRCGRELEVKDKLAGRQIQCPACKQLLRVPEQTKRAPEQTNSAFEALSQTSGKSRRGTLSSGARRMLLATGLFGVLFVALGAMGLCTYFFLKVQSLEKELAQASRRIDEPWTQEKAALEKRLKTVESEAKNARAEADFLRGRVAKSDSPPKEKIKDEKPPEGELVKETPAKDKPPTKNPAEAKEENAEANPYEAIDNHALRAPPEAEESIELLARYLARPAKNEKEKARSIFRWITDRIAYDAESLFSGQRGDNSAQGTLKARKAVCEGYANLFLSLCQKAELEAVKITGAAKGAEPPGAKLNGSGHAWNATRFGGEWHLMDPTWGAGHLQGRNFVKRFNDYYFQVVPAQLIFTHLPKDRKWQLLADPITVERFQAQPKVESAIFILGFAAVDLRRAMQEKGFREFARAFPPPGQVKVLQVPLQKYLRAGDSFTFRLESTDLKSMALQNNGKLIFFKQKGKEFEATVRAEPGRLLIVGSREANRPGNKLSGLLEYLVETESGKIPEPTPATEVLRVEDKLTANHPFDRVRQACKQVTHKVKMEPGRTYTIDLRSEDFDSYLRLEDSKGQQLEEDDDGGGFPHARITFRPDQPGVFHVIVTTFNQNETGAYQLTVVSRP